MKDYHQILTDFYRQHNPAKIGDVGSLLAKYRGNEEELLASLQKKYGAAGSGKNYRQIITDLYRQHNPEKLSQVDALLEKYAGSEEALVESLKKKYQGAAPVPSAPPPSSYQKPAAQAAPPVAAVSEPQNYRAIITEIYRKHSPEKISLVETLLEKYKGNEEALVDSLKKKYKDAPQAVAAQEPPVRVVREAAAAETESKDYRAIVTEIFSRHDPSSVNVVDALLKKYQGQEEVLIQYLMRKYGSQEEPEMPAGTETEPMAAGEQVKEPVFEEPSPEPAEKPVYTQPRHPDSYERQPVYEPARKLTPAEERAEYWRNAYEERKREKEMREHEPFRQAPEPVKATRPRDLPKPYKDVREEKVEKYAEERRKSAWPGVLAIVVIAVLLAGYAFAFINGTIRNAILTELGFVKPTEVANPPLTKEKEAIASDASKKTILAQDEQVTESIEPGEITNDADDFESVASGTLMPPCYIIVCGLYSLKENAIKEAERLKRNGLQAGYCFIPDYGGVVYAEDLYAAYAGPYQSRQSFEMELADVRIYKRDAVVWELGEKGFVTLLDYSP